MVVSKSAFYSFTSLLLVPYLNSSVVECKQAVRGVDSKTNLSMDQHDNIPLELVAPMEFREVDNETAVFVNVIKDTLLLDITQNGEKGRNLQTWCGDGNVGNGACNNGLCCSEWGWCGTDWYHCTGTCGAGNRGNGRCSNGECCSRWGYCGTDSSYCDNGSSPAAPPVAPPVSGGTCGNGYRGDGRCSNGLCCNQSGWCVGSSSSDCSPEPPTSTKRNIYAIVGGILGLLALLGGGAIVIKCHVIACNRTVVVENH